MGASPLADSASTLATVLLAQDGEPFIGSVLFFVIMGVGLAGLLGLLYYMRGKQDDD